MITLTLGGAALISDWLDRFHIVVPSSARTYVACGALAGSIFGRLAGEL
jgi:hypothetical protein